MAPFYPFLDIIVQYWPTFTEFSANFHPKIMILSVYYNFYRSVVRTPYPLPQKKKLYKPELNNFSVFWIGS